MPENWLESDVNKEEKWHFEIPSKNTYAGGRNEVTAEKKKKGKKYITNISR